MAGALLDSILRRWLLPDRSSPPAPRGDVAADDAQIPFSIIVPTAYGQMIVNRNDINQTNALFKTGRAIDHDEIMLLSQLLGLLDAVDLTVIDIGANFGTYSLGLAKAVGRKGRIHAFEPQRILFNMLAGSVALNSLTNVYCYNQAVGSTVGSIDIPQFDYFQPLNFGSVEFGEEQREPLNQQRQYGNTPDRVPLTTIDHFAFSSVDLMKIDAEGMELEVLKGARETLRRCRPVLYVEFVKVDQELLRQTLLAEDYAVHENGMNYLCIPIELQDRLKVS